jgi:hypothetical protein
LNDRVTYTLEYRTLQEKSSEIRSNFIN